MVRPNPGHFLFAPYILYQCLKQLIYKSERGRFIRVSTGDMRHADQAKRVAALFPAIIFVVVFAMGLQILPFYAGGVEYGYDPTYVYFFNGVSLADGFFSGYFDHPGTPLQLLIAAFTSTYWYILYLLG